MPASPTSLREIVPDHVAAELRTLGDRYGIRNIRVFGSFVRGEGGPDSDLDLLVLYLSDMLAAIERTLAYTTGFTSISTSSGTS